MKKIAIKNESALDSLPLICYSMRTVFAKREPSYKNSFDRRYDGWMPIWGQERLEWFYRILDEKALDSYVDYLLDNANSLPIVRVFAKEIVGRHPTIKYVRNKGAVAYRYYGSRTKGPYRICMEIKCEPKDCLC